MLTSSFLNCFTKDKNCKYTELSMSSLNECIIYLFTELYNSSIITCFHEYLKFQKSLTVLNFTTPQPAQTSLLSPSRG